MSPQNAELKPPADAAQWIEEEVRGFVRTSSLNRLSFLNDYAMWDEPLVQSADGDDPIFTEYKTIIAATHLTPREALAKAYGMDPEDLPERLSVISWILPTAKETREANRAETRLPSRLWSHTRFYGEQFNEALRRHVVEVLTGQGYQAAAPVLQPYFERAQDEKGPYSNWSERHIAYAAGLGTFSLSDGFITELGIAHRCGSVVTDLVLPASPMTAGGPYSNCLAHVGVSCNACIERCPADAISEQGHDKNRCSEYLDGIVNAKDGHDSDTWVVGCGLCQTKVPCEDCNPTKDLKRRE